jgi:putative PIN family toxin of toxin-antitoxin system
MTPLSASSARYGAGEPPKVVIDTNVWLAAILRRERAACFVLDHVKGGVLRVCMSLPIIGEVVGVLHEIGLPLRDLKRGTVVLIRILCGNSVFFHPRIALEACVEDPSDNVFVDCAYEADATIVSKNTHLLELDSEVSSRTGTLIRVLAPEHYMKEAMMLRGTVT